MDRPQSMEDFETMHARTQAEQRGGQPQAQPVAEEPDPMVAGINQINESIAGGVNDQFEPVAESGPTLEDIELWRKQYPKAKIFRVSITNEQYFYKTLNRVEYKNIIGRNDLNAISREEVIAHTCCLWPRLDAQTIGEGPAGNIASLAQIIMRTSGFDEPEEVERLA